ncbi:MAG: choice-of-anchor D domain-containing protein, partial [Planctomycetes bacterium]|nr:choice-of-anchor D domain-containing protein [Planctomycetota bacterium]
MKRFCFSLTVLFFIVSLSSPAFAQTIIHTIPTPDNFAWGVTWIEDYLWVVSGTGENEIFSKVDPEDGTVLEVVSDPGDDVKGLAYDGTNLLGADKYGSAYDVLSAILSINLSTGDLLNTLQVPGDYIGGVEWVDETIWYTRYYPDNEASIVQVDPGTGDVLQTIPTPADQPYGLAWDGSSFWLADEIAETVYQIDPADGSVISTFESPSPSSSDLRGACWDGQYLWVIDNGIDGKTLYQIDVGGAGTPDIYVPATSYDFGPTIIGETAAWSLTISNVGDGPLTISDITSLSAPFNLESVTLPLTLEPGQNFTLEISFTPQVAGFFSANLTIESDDPDEGTITVELDGQGLVADPSIVLSAPDHDFGPVQIGAAARWILEITNIGYDNLQITSMDFATYTGGFSIPDYDYPLVIPSWEAITVPIIFIPFDSGHDANLEIYSNDPDDNPAIVSLSGTGISETQYGGAILWTYQCPENVNVVTEIEDLDGDYLNEAVVETFDAGMDGDHLLALKGNAYQDGFSIWTSAAMGGPSQSGGWGDKCMTVMPDVNDDGYEEVIVGTAWGGRTVHLVSGVSGDVLWYYDTYGDPYGGGWVYTVDFIPDVSGDGKPDVLAGSGSSDGGINGKIGYCFNSASGEVIWRYQAQDGISDCKSIDDVDGDDLADAVFTTGTNFTSNQAICVSGGSQGIATSIWTYTSSHDVFTVDIISDITGDNKREVVIGDWDGNVVCLNAQNGLPVWTQDVGGGVMRLENMGDINGDGIDDLIVAPGGNFAPTTAFRALDGQDGEILWSVTTGGSVWAVGSVGDLNDDGINEGLGGSFDGGVYCVDGTNGNALWTTFLGAKVFSMHSIADVSSDGWPDVLAGTQYLGGNGGQVFCIEGGDEPTPVELLSFSGQSEVGGVRLSWEMLSLADVTGFNIYRKAVPAEPQSVEAVYERIKPRDINNSQAIMNAICTEIKMATF